MPQREVARMLTVRIYADEEHIYGDTLEHLELVHGGASNAMKALMRKYGEENYIVPKPADTGNKRQD